MKYVIYALVAALSVWAVCYLVKAVRRQLKGGCGCGCGGDCARCASRQAPRRP